MVFQKMRAARQAVRWHFEQMLLHRLRISGKQAVIELLVISEVKAQRLQTRLQAPVSLGQEYEIGMKSPYRGDCIRPKLGGGGRFCCCQMFPGSGKHVAQE